MASSTSLFRTYIWVLDTINRAQAITYENLNRLWVKTKMSDGTPIPRRNFTRYLNAIEEMFGIEIVCDRRDNTFSIKDSTHALRRNTLVRWMLNTMTVVGVVQESRTIQDRIILEEVPSGDDYLVGITRAMEHGNTIQVQYRKFVDSEAYSAEIEPYSLKLFRRRWYLLGRRTDRSYLAIYALDRMLSVEQTGNTYQMPEGFSARDFFAPMFGVFKPTQEQQEQVIKLRTYNGEWNYLRTLPLHPSQREMLATADYVDFLLRLSPTKDFCMELLSRGANIEVVSPRKLRNEMQRMVSDMAERYGK